MKLSSNSSSSNQPLGTTSLRPFSLDHTVPSRVNLARFLDKNGHQEPLELKKFGNHTDLLGEGIFELCQGSPSAGASFIGLMAPFRNHEMDWTDVYGTSNIIGGAET